MKNNKIVLIRYLIDETNSHSIFNPKNSENTGFYQIELIFLTEI